MPPSLQSPASSPPARRGRGRWIVAGLGATLLALAAGAAAMLLLGGGDETVLRDTTTTPTTPNPTAPPRKTVESFSDPSDSWFVAQTEDYGSGQLEQGGFRIRVTKANSSYEAANDFDPATKHAFVDESRIGPGDARMTVDAAKLGGPNDNEFGVYCTDEEGWGYYMSVSSDGYAAIFRWLNDEITTIRDWKQSGAIQKGADTNHIVGECRGGRDGAPAQLKLWVNGRGVAQGRDLAGIAPTYFGIYAGSFDKAGVDVLFDNFALERLDYAAFLERVRARTLRE